MKSKEKLFNILSNKVYRLESKIGKKLLKYSVNSLKKNLLSQLVLVITQRLRRKSKTLQQHARKKWT